tara:strand:- start:210 stop:479 length:270 start_codon:yes stop_codon:yes gene_type:complete
MSRPRKPYKVIGKDKKIHIPQPPTRATHVHLQVGNRKAVVPIIDFDVLLGSDGWFHYVRCDKNMKVVESFDGEWFWNGRTVKGIEKLLK